MSVVFMGTPALALPCLEATAAWAARRGARLSVITQPDRPRGRSGQPQPSPVKALALELGAAIHQPLRLRADADLLAALAAAPPRVIVVVAYGQLLPPAVLEAPALGCVNVHFSALPRWRGAAPVQRAIMAGDTTTGIDTMLMDVGLDTGPVLLHEATPIGAHETAGELADRLATLAPAVLTRTLDALEAGALTPQPQDEARATHAPRLTKAEGALDWREPAAVLYDRFRGVTPWPGATAEVAGEPVAVLAARPGEGHGAPGEILAIDETRGMLCAAGQNALWLEKVRAPGRTALAGAVYARGRRFAGG